MKRFACFLVVALAAADAAFAQPRQVSVKVSFSERLGPLEIDRMALGQGGLSDEPMWDSRIAEIRVEPGNHVDSGAVLVVIEEG